MKPFLPQLQRTFIKSLTDPTSAIVRARAAAALSILISLQSRVDPLVTELVAGIKSSEAGVKETVMGALESVVSKIGAGMSDVAKRAVMGVVMEGMESSNPGKPLALLCSLFYFIFDLSWLLVLINDGCFFPFGAIDRIHVVGLCQVARCVLQTSDP